MVSKRSMNKLALLVRASGVTFSSAMTVSYGVNYPLNGKEVKKHLNHFLVSLKRAFGSFEYVWCLEFQERGAPHFHILTTLKKPDFDMRWKFSDTWAGVSVPFIGPYCRVLEENGKLLPGGLYNTHNACMAVHTHQNAWERIRKPDGAGRYMAKYANKLRQKKVPSFYSDVGRFWGASRGVKLPDGQYMHGTDQDVRQLAAEYGRDISRWDVLPKVILLG